MSLQEEIEKKAKEIHTSGYPMSIGELISLYNDGEIDLHPEFQRFFRWTPLQKARFIESILIGIPIPSIFVYQREDGVWDVIDGVQRLSTIFQFVGILKDENGEGLLPGKMVKTDILPSLEGKMWKPDKDEDEDEPENFLTMSQRIEFKRAKLDIKIIKEDGDQDARYELFKRINTGGTALSDVELRKFLLAMINTNFCLSVQELASNDNFSICTQITEDLFKNNYDLDLVSRFLVLKNSTGEELESLGDLSVFITDKMAESAKKDTIDMEKEREIFEKTFNLLVGSLKDNSFRKYNKEDNSFSGRFSIAAYEVIAIGIGANIDKWKNDDVDKLKSKIKSVWEDSRFSKLLEKSEDDKDKVFGLVSLGRELFSHENQNC